MSTKSKSAAPWLGVLLLAAVDLLAPIGIFYAARAAGAAPTPALLLAAVPPAAHAAVTLVRRRTVEWLPVLVLAATLAGAATSMISDSPRFLLAKDAAITGALGLALLLSARSPRPALYALARDIVAAAGHATDDWQNRWQTSATFRRLWRVLTVGWGLGLLLDAVLRAACAYLLPVDIVPMVTTIQWIVLVITLNVLSQVHLRRPAHRHLVFE